MGVSKIPTASITYTLPPDDYKATIIRSEPGKGKGQNKWFIHFQIEGSPTIFIHSFSYPLLEGSPIARFAKRAAEVYDLCDEAAFVGVGVKLTIEDQVRGNYTVSTISNLKFRKRKDGSLVTK